MSIPYPTRRGLSITEKFQGGGGVGKEQSEAEILRLHTPHHLQQHTTTGVVTLTVLPMGISVAHGKQLFVCGSFPQGKIASGKFPWIRQKEQKNHP